MNANSKFVEAREIATQVNPRPGISRRTALKSTFAVAGAGTLGLSTIEAAESTNPDPRRLSAKRYQMKKSINLWAFPYPQRMSLRECLQLAKDAGFDGIELNYDLENDGYGRDLT